MRGVAAVSGTAIASASLPVVALIRRYCENKMVCLEKVRLVEEYSVASSTLVLANTKLKTARKAHIGVSAALGVWKAASAKCVVTRQALQEHKAKHSC